MKSYRVLALALSGLLYLLGNGIAEESKKTEPKKEWVWLNGSLVYLNPDDMKASKGAEDVKVNWNLDGGKLTSHVEGEKVVIPPPPYDPMLSEVAVKPWKIPVKPRPKKVRPMSFDETLPRNLRGEGAQEGPDLKNPKKLEEFPVQFMNASQLQRYGVILKEQSDALKKRFEEIEKTRSPEAAVVKAYLKDSDRFMLRLEGYRERALQLREEAQKD